MAATMFRHDPLEHPLKQIRLLQIQGLTGIDLSEPITCTIRHVDVASAERYIAVSYAWGVETPLLSIFLNGQRKNVRSNLFDFLQQTRESWPSLADSSFWIDQLCIDQTSTKERAEQVAIMGDVYAQANRTIVWLGKNLKRSRDDDDTPSTRTSRRILVDWARLCTNNYWSRLWIVQEICFSTSIVIMTGRTTLSWKDFVEEFRTLTAGELLESTRSQTIQRLVETRMLFATDRGSQNTRTKFKPLGLSLNVALQWFSGLNCLDVRDQLYGLMSLVKVQERVEVDYTITPEELFVNTTNRARQIYPSDHDHAAFCLLLLTRLNLESSKDAEISFKGTDRCYSKAEVLKWSEQLGKDPSEYRYMTTTAGGRTSRYVCQERFSVTGTEEDRHEPFAHSVSKASNLPAYLQLANFGAKSPVRNVQALGCPMVKANPARYIAVVGPCTDLKGLSPQPKALMEHLEEQHSRRNRCLKCRRWYKSVEQLREHKLAWNTWKHQCDQCCKRFRLKKEMQKHIDENQCVRDESRHPQLLTPQQEKAFDRLRKKGVQRGSIETTFRWIFKNLWPKHPQKNSIWPYYDFAIFTHLLPGPTLSQDFLAATSGGLKRGVQSSPLSSPVISRVESSLGLADQEHEAAADTAHDLWIDLSSAAMAEEQYPSERPWSIHPTFPNSSSAAMAEEQYPSVWSGYMQTTFSDPLPAAMAEEQYTSRVFGSMQTIFPSHEHGTFGTSSASQGLTWRDDLLPTFDGRQIPFALKLDADVLWAADSLYQREDERISHSLTSWPLPMIPEADERQDDLEILSRRVFP